MSFDVIDNLTMSQRWYVIHTKPRKEEFLAGQMLLRKIETFHPRIRVQTVNPRAHKIKSYFPGYVFAHLDFDQAGRSSLNYLPGATGLVCFDGEAAEVPDGLIHAIRQRVDAINSAGGELLESLKHGDKVLIHSGPFSGYEAIFDAKIPGSERVRILLSMLKQRQIPLDLSAGNIRKKK